MQTRKSRVALAKLSGPRDRNRRWKKRGGRVRGRSSPLKTSRPSRLARTPWKANGSRRHSKNHLPTPLAPTPRPAQEPTPAIPAIIHPDVYLADKVKDLVRLAREQGFLTNKDVHEALAEHDIS